MNYVNPASFMPNADFRVNPLQGAFAGQAQGMMSQLMDRTYRDSDLSYLDQLHTYNMSVAKDPETLANIQAETAEANNRTAIAQNPLSTQAPLSDLSTKVDTNDTKKVINQQTIEGARNGLVVQMNEEFKNNPPDFTKNPQGAAKQWSDWQQKFAKVGVNLPPQPDADFMASLPAKAQAALQNLDYQRRLGEIAAQGSNQEKVANIQGGYGVTRANIQAGASRDVANIGAGSRQAVAEMQLKDDTSIRSVLAKAAATGDVTTAKMFASELAMRQARLAASQDIRMIQAQARQDPAAIANIEQEYYQRYMAEYSGIIGQAAAGRQRTGVDSTVDKALNPTQPAAPAKSKYTPGMVVDGYQFKGGDPTKQENWEKQQ